MAAEEVAEFCAAHYAKAELTCSHADQVRVCTQLVLSDLLPRLARREAALTIQPCSRAVVTLWRVGGPKFTPRYISCTGRMRQRLGGCGRAEHKEALPIAMGLPDTGSRTRQGSALDHHLRP